MTEHDFKAGWRLLVMQPWGWRYNQLENGKPTTATLEQLQLYYHKLNWAHPEAWMKTAHQYAEGAEWPSLKEVQATLAFHNQNVLAEQARTMAKRLDGPEAVEDFNPMPPEVRAVLERLGRKMTMDPKTPRSKEEH